MDCIAVDGDIIETQVVKVNFSQTVFLIGWVKLSFTACNIIKKEIVEIYFMYASTVIDFYYSSIKTREF